MKRWLTPYGNYFSLNRRGIHLMINGYMLSLFISLHTGKWKTSCWSNVWRKSKKSVYEYGDHLKS